MAPNILDSNPCKATLQVLFLCAFSLVPDYPYYVIKKGHDESREFLGKKAKFLTVD
jgi:hypothetical protein